MFAKQTNIIIVPPVVSTSISTDDDIIVARDTARRVAMLLGLSPLLQARYSTIAAEISRLVIRTDQYHRMDFYGIQQGMDTGIQLGCQMPWLVNKPYDLVCLGLEQKLDALADVIEVTDVDALPYARFTIWCAKDNDHG